MAHSVYLRDGSPPGRAWRNMDGMTTTTIEVDFHLKADSEHTYGLADEIFSPGPVEVGQRLLATDGDVTHWAVLDALDRRGALLLRVLWNETVLAIGRHDPVSGLS